MTYNPSPSISDFGAWFGLIIEGLCRAVGIIAAKQRPHDPRIDLVWHYLRRLARRFARRAERLRAGPLPPPKPRPVCDPPGAAPPARKPRPRLPEGVGWLAQFGPEIRSFGSQLQHFLSAPDTVALLAASPATASMVRPLCRLLAIEPTPPLPPALPSARTRPRPAPRTRRKIPNAARPEPPPDPPAAPPRHGLRAFLRLGSFRLPQFPGRR